MEKASQKDGDKMNQIPEPIPRVWPRCYSAVSKRHISARGLATSAASTMYRRWGA
jgi:hypothetical protein